MGARRRAADLKCGAIAARFRPVSFEALLLLRIPASCASGWAVCGTLEGGTDRERQNGAHAPAALSVGCLV